MFSINLGWLIALCLVLNQFHSTTACLRKAPIQPILICEDEVVSGAPSSSGVTNPANVRNGTMSSGDPGTTPSENGVTTTPNHQTTSSGSDVKTSTNTPVPSEVTTTKPKCREVVVRKDTIDKAGCDTYANFFWMPLGNGLPTECIEVRSASIAKLPLGNYGQYAWCGKGSVLGLMHPDILNKLHGKFKNGNEAWLGPTSTNGVFRMPDGTPLKYANWKDNHPHSNKIKTKAQCVKVTFAKTAESGIWDVADCESTKLNAAFCYTRKAVKATLCGEALEDYDRKVASKEWWRKKCTYDYEHKDSRDSKKHGKCPSGWTIYRPAAKCYKKLEKNTYEDLISDCDRLGGKLSSVHTHHQQKFLRALLGGDSEIGDFYIGLNRMPRKDRTGRFLPERFEDGSVRDFGLWPVNKPLLKVTVDKGVGSGGDPMWEDGDGTGKAYGICSLNVPGTWNIPECEHYVEPNGLDY